MVAALLEDPPAFPGWPLRRWRLALHSSRRAGPPPACLGDPRLRPLFAWLESHTRRSARLAAAASMLAVLDRAVSEKRHDPMVVAERLVESVATAKPFATRTKTKARGLPGAPVDAGRPSSLERSAEAGSPLVEIAAGLLRQAGIDLHAASALAGRLSAALDLTISHWLGDAPASGGLPEFRPEHRWFYTNRLSVQLGADRGLLRLLHGPHPGRGRPLQVARRRGLAYWVATAWVADQLGQPPPQLPPQVVAHWRRELQRLNPPPTPAISQEADSRYAPSA